MTRSDNSRRGVGVCASQSRRHLKFEEMQRRHRLRIARQTLSEERDDYLFGSDAIVFPEFDEGEEDAASDCDWQALRNS